jgi:hypothetical protein
MNVRCMCVMFRKIQKNCYCYLGRERKNGSKVEPNTVKIMISIKHHMRVVVFFILY